MLRTINEKFTFTFFEIGLVVSVMGAVVVVVVVAQEVVVASVTKEAPFMQLSTGKPSISGKSLVGHGNEPEEWKLTEWVSACVNGNKACKQNFFCC